MSAAGRGGSEAGPHRSWRFARPHPPPLAVDCALFLDIDGTLAEFAATPREVRVDRQLIEALPFLRARHGGALALVTGRSITDVDRIFPELGVPVAGQHGCERRDAQGKLHLHASDPAVLRKLRELFAAFAARHPGLLLEDKGATVALHYRQLPELAGHVHSVARSTFDEAGGEGYSLWEGKELVEIRPDGRDKGKAIVDFMRELPFAGRMPVFVGDDVTDEDGFSAVDALGGWSVKVGAGHTRAQYRLLDIAAARRWLLTSASIEQGERA
jgi:trehalose 6-phosphate phosphatase